ncbi:hypothetical protein ACFX1Z_018358 [Malus domestica]
MATTNSSLRVLFAAVLNHLSMVGAIQKCGTTECLMRTKCGVWTYKPGELNDGSTPKKSKEIQGGIHGVPFSPGFYICGRALQQRSLNPFSAGTHRCICVA